MSPGNQGTTMTDRPTRIMVLLFAAATIVLFIFAMLNLAGTPQGTVTRAIEKTFVRLLTGRIVP